MLRRAWRTVLVDQRCHGGSAFRGSLAPPHSMLSSAADMSRLTHQVLSWVLGFRLKPSLHGPDQEPTDLSRLTCQAPRLPAPTRV